MIIYSNFEFKNMNTEEIENFINQNKQALAGSAIFVKGKSKISKMISWVCKGKSENKEFVPSHVGSLVLVGRTIYKFDMMPPCAKITSLKDYIKKSKETYIIAMRNFDIDVEKFSIDVCSRLNRRYGYLSALQSAFKYLYYPFREHCSEIHLRCLQNQGLFKEYSPNATTPDDLFRMLRKTSGSTNYSTSK